MDRIYFIQFPSDGEGNLLYRTVDADSSEEFMAYIDCMREHGLKEAEPLFPKKWVWVDEDSKKLPIGDMPISMGCIVLLQHVFEVFQQRFKNAALNVHPIAVGDVKMAWFQAPVIDITQPQTAATFPPIFSIEKSYKRACSAEFKEWWEANGFTGVEFKEIICFDIHALFNDIWRITHKHHYALPAAPTSPFAEVMSEREFSLFTSRFPDAVSDIHHLTVNGEAIVRFHVPKIDPAQYPNGAALPPLFSINETYKRSCSTQFKEWWEENGSTKMEFKHVI